MIRIRIWISDYVRGKSTTADGKNLEATDFTATANNLLVTLHPMFDNFERDDNYTVWPLTISLIFRDPSDLRLWRCNLALDECLLVFILRWPSNLRPYYGRAHEYRLRSSMEPRRTEQGGATDRQATKRYFQRHSVSAPGRQATDKNLQV